MSEHVIYNYKAHAICQNCNTDNGEAFFEDVGKPDHRYPPVEWGWSCRTRATVIAYGELRARIEAALQARINESK